MIASAFGGGLKKIFKDFFVVVAPGDA